MAVIKPSGSGKAVQIILSEDLPAGSILQTSASVVMGMLSRGNGGEFKVLTLLPVPTGANKFPQSPTYDAGTGKVIASDGNKGLLSNKAVDNKKQLFGVSDKEVNL